MGVDGEGDFLIFLPLLPGVVPSSWDEEEEEEEEGEPAIVVDDLNEVANPSFPQKGHAHGLLKGRTCR